MRYAIARNIHQFAKLPLTIVCVLMLAVATYAQGDSFQPGQIVVGLTPGADIQAFNTQYGTTMREQIAGTDQYLLDLAPGASVETLLAQIATDPRVVFSGPNFNFQHAEVRQQSHAFVDQQSHAFVDNQSPAQFFVQPPVLRLRLADAQKISRGRGVLVAVIDTGIDSTHPLFAGRLAATSYDFVGNDADPQEEGSGNGFGHGTFVAGLIALTAPDALIMPLRAFGADGMGTTFNIAKAIRYAADNGAKVINLSFGLLQRDKLIDDALSYAYSRSFMVASAGNDNRDFLHFPSERISKALPVVSTDALDYKAWFSNYNRNAQTAAPGVDLYSAYPGGLWATWSGTSFSTALVSGEAALILQLSPTVSRSAMAKVITSSGYNLDKLNPAYAKELGTRIDYLQAVKTTKSK